ncbi:MAG: hypothetical protein FWC50_00370 [Planctomycetaceae bacterium]|nr:hypothetical protein [Planctomycetaceae bacterium]
MKRNKMLFFFCKSLFPALFLAVTCAGMGGLSSGAVADDSPANKTTEEWKTVSVISFTSADTGIATVKQLVKAAGHEGAIDRFEKQARENFKTMDFSKPKGLVVQTNGKTFNIFFFLPLNDVTALPFEIGKKVATSEKDENGWYKIPLPTHNFLYVNQQKGWAYATFGPRLPKNLPVNPVTLLEGLDKEYLIAARFNAQNMPKSILGGYAMMGKQMIPMIRMFAPIQNQPEDVRELMTNYFDFFEKVIGNMIDLMVKTFRETDSMTYGFKVNGAGDLIVKSRVVVLPDTETAKIIAETAKMKTNLIGFYQPEGTIFSVVGTQSLSDTQKKFFKDYLEGYVSLMTSVFKKARNTSNKPEGVGKFLDGMEAVFKAGLEVAHQTIDSGKLDVAETVFPGGSLLIAFSVVDGKRLLPAIDSLFELAQESMNKDFGKDFAKIEKISYADSQIRSFSIPVSRLKGNNSETPKSPGDEMFSAVLAVGDRLLAFSYGLGTSEEHLDRMKKGIDASKTAVAVPKTLLVSTPQQLGVLLKKFVDLSQGELQQPAQILYDAPQDATITITNDFSTPNVAAQKMVVSGKLLPTFGRFGEIIVEQIKKTTEQFKKDRSQLPQFGI